ncbi:hypothetical protein EBO34_03815 [Alteribacter keqinensis]|uniref:Uncharacterized protein n=1 Tax=Alteribacter keqinensis TaxID=2483800 RepID=A0A3M7TV01_9BACI|nr:hypothetical protein EBO34_03815 [Alteribacter keqinensis]
MNIPLRQVRKAPLKVIRSLSLAVPAQPRKVKGTQASSSVFQKKSSGNSRIFSFVKGSKQYCILMKVMFQKWDEACRQYQNPASFTPIHLKWCK